MPMEKKLEVNTARVPNEYVSYLKMGGYNRNGRRHQGNTAYFSDMSSTC